MGASRADHARGFDHPTAIPVAMPTVLSVTMADGARLLAGKQAVVSRLAAVGELAGADVLCSDSEDGYAHADKLTLGVPSAVEGITADQVILDAALASRRENKDPIDLAVLTGPRDGQVGNGYRVVHFQPLDPVHKRTEATIQGPDGKTFKVRRCTAGDRGAGGQRARLRARRPSRSSRCAVSARWAGAG